MAVKTSFELNDDHCINDHEAIIQDDFNFFFRKIIGKVTDQKGSISLMLMIEVNKMVVTRKRCGSSKTGFQ